MKKKKQVYESDVLALPSLKMVLNNIPEPDPEDKRQPLRTFGNDKSEVEARTTLAKLIGHLKNNEQ